MNNLQIQEIYNKIVECKDFYKSYGTNFDNYEDTCNLFNNLLIKLENNLSYTRGQLYSNSETLYSKLLKQDLELRKNFVKLNKLHDDDVKNLSMTIMPNIRNNIPTLELFPGVGQFLPFAVASEPLYVVDRYIEICESAADSLNNDFYKNRRLRKYSTSEFDLSMLPYNEFGLVYCFNEFYYANMEYICSWAFEVFNLLHEGGKFIFNFMPYDQIWAIESNLKLDFTVIDYNILIEKLTSYGYFIEYYKIQPFRSSYIVAKKPGNIEPRYKIRGAYAEIIDN
jgi:hypothetical protein